MVSISHNLDGVGSQAGGWELGLSYLQLQGHFAIYLHLHFTVPRVMF